MKDQGPNIVSRGFYGLSNLFEIAGRAVNAVTDVYVIAITSSTKPPSGSALVVSETIGKKYVILDSDHEKVSGYTDDISVASLVSFFHGMSIVAAVNKHVQTHNEQGEEFTTRASLISYGSAQFLAAVQAKKSESAEESE